MMQSNVAPTIEANDRSGLIHLPECESDVAVRDGRPGIGRISTGFRPPQAVDEELGCLFQVQNGKAEVVDAFGDRHTVSVAPNAAVQRPRAARSSAARVHNEVTHMRRARTDVSRSAATAC